MNKKSNEDQGFEIIKEVGAPRMGMPNFGMGGMFGSNPSISSLAALIQGGSMSNINNVNSLLAGAGAGNMSGLINQSSMLQKCE